MFQPNLDSPLSSQSSKGCKSMGFKSTINQNKSSPRKAPAANIPVNMHGGILPWWKLNLICCNMKLFSISSPFSSFFLLILSGDKS